MFVSGIFSIAEISFVTAIPINKIAAFLKILVLLAVFMVQVYGGFVQKIPVSSENF
jgi:hypothetical protein